MDLSQRSDLTQSVHRSSGSFELVLGAVIFGLIGLLIDRALGITPVLTIVFTVGGLTGAVVSVYVRYRSQMAELAGKFAGIVLVTIPDDRVDEFTASLEPLHGLLDVTVQRAADAPVEAAATRWSLELLGTDRPGIISDVTAVLAAHGVNIDALTTSSREAPMAGEMLFEAIADLDVPLDVDAHALRAALENIANELMVDIDLDATM